MPNGPGFSPRETPIAGECGRSRTPVAGREPADRTIDGTVAEALGQHLTFVAAGPRQAVPRPAIEVTQPRKVLPQRLEHVGTRVDIEREGNLGEGFLPSAALLIVERAVDIKWLQGERRGYL
jgi:hypothetical protein